MNVPRGLGAEAPRRQDGQLGTRCGDPRDHATPNAPVAKPPSAEYSPAFPRCSMQTLPFRTPSFVSSLSLALCLLAPVGCDGKPEDSDSTVDADSDGYPERVDCDDADSAVHPEALEICDGVDNDCNDKIDDDDAGLDPESTPKWYTDGDLDGFGSAETAACIQPAGTIAVGMDCDDANADAYPGAIEICNDIDDDCDTLVDAADDNLDPSGSIAWYTDADGDGYGAPATLTRGCVAPADVTLDGSDCDDTNPAVSPEGTEICDAADNDCDPTTSDAGMASFQGRDGSLTDVTRAVLGAVDDPADITLDSGTLWLCDGIFHASVEFIGDATVAGVHDGAILDGTGGGSTVWVETDGVTATINTVAILGGSGRSSVALGENVGGGALCQADAELILTNVDISGSSAFFGAGLTSTSCDTTLTDTVIHDNAAELAIGGAFLADGTHDWTRVEVRDNYGPDFVGGMYLWTVLYDGSALYNFEDVIVADNVTDGSVSGIWMDDGTLDWTSTSPGRSALTGNVDGGFTALYFNSYGEGSSKATFSGVDMGTEAGGDDNTTSDVFHGYYGRSYKAGDNASFSCDTYGCGTVTTYTTGSESGASTSSDLQVGTVVLADTETTIQEMSMGVTSTGDCTAWMQVFSAADPTTSWTLLDGAYSISVPSSGEISTDELSVLTELGVYYALVASVYCDSGYADVAYVDAPTTDMGFGTAVGTVGEVSAYTNPDYTYVAGVASLWVTNVGIVEL